MGPALGHKNNLFVGDVRAGRNITGLYSLVVACEARSNKLNLLSSLTHVLPRIGEN